MLNADDLATLPPTEARAFLGGLTDDQAIALKYDWRFWARANQLPPAGDWLTWLVMCGRGFGKTRLGSEWIRSMVEGPSPLSAPPGAPEYVTIIADTPADLRDYIIDGPSGIRACCPPDRRPEYVSTRRSLEWPNGCKALLFSAEDPEALRGASGSVAWWDELAKSRYAADGWENLMYGLREATPKILVTTTPRPVQLIRDLLNDPTTHLTRGSTRDNEANLSDVFINKIIKPREGTRLGRQEIDGELLLDVPGALWTLDLIERNRVDAPPVEFDRIVVAVDPPATAGGDECGIVAAGLVGSRSDGTVYVLDDQSEGGLSPNQWAAKAIRLYEDVGADRIVIETNQGGDMAENTLRQVSPNVPIKRVHASKGKRTRAEPVSALSEKGRVRHVGLLKELEDQMTSYTGSTRDKSPDRMDAFVYAVTELVLEKGPAQWVL